jgi:hypothetical protein
VSPVELTEDIGEKGVEEEANHTTSKKPGSLLIIQYSTRKTRLPSTPKNKKNLPWPAPESSVKREKQVHVLHSRQYFLNICTFLNSHCFFTVFSIAGVLKKLS